MQRTIVHLDADAFFASVEQAADLRIRNKPVAVGGGKRGIIASASYEARRMGVYTPMPVTRALRLCPDLILLPGDFEKYERFSRWMFSHVQDFTPDLEIGSIDEGYFDLTRVHRPPVEIAKAIVDAIHQSLKISVSIGIGGSKLVSQIASKLRKPGGFVQVPAGEETRFLHPLASRWLPGVGVKTAARFDAAGLKRIGEVAVAPIDFLASLVGKYAFQLKNFANGMDDRPLIFTPEAAQSYSQQETFETDVDDRKFLEAALCRMADALMATVRRDGKSIRTLTVKVRYTDMTEDQRAESLWEPTNLETDVYPRLGSLLQQAWKRRGRLRLVGLKFSNVHDGHFCAELPLEPRGQQRETRRRLTAAVDQVRRTYGFHAIMREHDLRNDPRSQQALEEKHGDSLVG